MADSKQHRDQDEMETLLDEFEKQVRVGKMHFWVWRDLGKSLSKDPDLGNEAPGFFQLTLRAHMNEAFMHLSKLFDKSSDVVKLSDLLECAEQNAGKFTGISSEKVRNELLPKWRKKIDKMQKDVEPVKVRRNKLLAHLDPKAISDFPAVAEESKITVDELEKLYDGVCEVVDNVSRTYRNLIPAMEFVGWADFKNVLELMKLGKSARQEEFDRLVKNPR